MNIRLALLGLAAALFCLLAVVLDAPGMPWRGLAGGVAGSGGDRGGRRADRRRYLGGEDRRPRRSGAHRRADSAQTVPSGAPYTPGVERSTV